MTHKLYEIIKLLEARRVSFTIKRVRDDTITVVARFLCEFTEIDVFEDGDVDVCRFKGNEDVEVDPGLEALRAIIRERT